MTELVFGPMRTRSRDLAVDANEHAVEVTRSGWAVRVPWGEAAELLEADLYGPRTARTTAYPKLLEFGWSRARLEIESIFAPGLVPRFSAADYYSNEQSWYVWSAPNEDRIDTELEISNRQPTWPFWLRGTDGLIAAISQRESSETCAYMCNPLLTVLISLETGAGVELRLGVQRRPCAGLRGAGRFEPHTRCDPAAIRLVRSSPVPQLFGRCCERLLLVVG